MPIFPAEFMSLPRTRPTSCWKESTNFVVVVVLAVQNSRRYVPRYRCRRCPTRFRNFSIGTLAEPRRTRRRRRRWRMAASRMARVRTSCPIKFQITCRSRITGITTNLQIPIIKNSLCNCKLNVLQKDTYDLETIVSVSLRPCSSTCEKSGETVALGVRVGTCRSRIHTHRESTARSARTSVRRPKKHQNSFTHLVSRTVGRYSHGITLRLRAIAAILSRMPTETNRLTSHSTPNCRCGHKKATNERKDNDVPIIFPRITSRV